MNSIKRRKYSIGGWEYCLEAWESNASLDGLLRGPRGPERLAERMPGPRIPLGRPPHLEPTPSAPGAQRGVVRRHGVPPPEPVELADALEGLLIDATGGDPPGMNLGKRLERVAREFLLRRGLSDARVEVSSGPRGTFVRVWLAPGGPAVREIKVEIG